MPPFNSLSNVAQQEVTFWDVDLKHHIFLLFQIKAMLLLIWRAYGTTLGYTCVCALLRNNMKLSSVSVSSDPIN